MEHILEMQRKAAEQEPTEDAKKEALRRYPDAVLALTRAFALASASTEAKGIREEVGFFQAIRAALVKSVDTKQRRQDLVDAALYLRS